MKTNFFKVLACFVLLLTFLPNLVSAAPITLPTMSVLGGGFNSINGSQFTSDSRFIVTGTSSGTIAVWKTLNGQLEKEIKGANTDYIIDLALSPNDRYVASKLYRGDIIVWDLQNNKAAYTVDLPFSSGGGGDSLYNKDGTIIYVRDFDTKSIYMLDAANGAIIDQFSYSDNPTAMAYNPQTNQLAIGFRRGAITIIDGTNGDYISTISQSVPSAGANVTSLAYSPTGDELVATRMNYYSLQFFDVNNNYTYNPTNNNNINVGTTITSAFMSPNNKYIVVSAFGGMRVYDKSTQERVANAAGDRLAHFSISPNGQYLFANRTLFNFGVLPSVQMTGIEIDKPQPLMNFNSSQTVNVYALYDDGSKKSLDSSVISWHSSNPNVASVNAGRIQAGAQAKGTTTITASYNGFTTSANVEVNNVKTEEKRVNVEVNKTWTVTFNLNVLSSSVNAQTIYVVDSKNNPVPLRFSVTGAKTQITPINPYQSKEAYKLFIKDVKSADGQTLQPYSMMEFTIR